MMPYNLFISVYKTVSGVNGPLVILDKVKVGNLLGIKYHWLCYIIYFFISVGLGSNLLSIISNPKYLNIQSTILSFLNIQGYLLLVIFCPAAY